MPEPQAPTPKPTYIVGLDLGQTQDPSALVVLEKTVGPWKPNDSAAMSRLANFYNARFLHRWPLQTAYTDIVKDVSEWIAKSPLPGSQLVIDETGVGRAVVEMFRRASIKARITAVTITCGAAVTQVPGGWHTAKKQLASTVQNLLQTRRIKFAKLPETDRLVQELRDFRVRVTANQNETFESWRDKAGDDLVLALAMAAWLGERTGPTIARPVQVLAGTGARSGASPYPFGLL